MSANNDFEKIKDLEDRRDDLQEAMEREDFESISLSMLGIISDGTIELYRSISDMKHQMVELTRQLHDLREGSETDDVSDPLDLMTRSDKEDV